MEVEVWGFLRAEIDPNTHLCFRTEARESFKDIPFFATWDPLSLELYINCQLWEDKETGETKLKTSGIWVGSLLFNVNHIDCSSGGLSVCRTSRTV